VSQTKGYQQPPGAGKGKGNEFSIGAKVNIFTDFISQSKVAQWLYHKSQNPGPICLIRPISDFLPPEPEEYEFVVLHHQFSGNLLQQPQKQIQ
jgi:hypothetical protein